MRRHGSDPEGVKRTESMARNDFSLQKAGRGRRCGPCCAGEGRVSPGGGGNFWAPPRTDLRQHFTARKEKYSGRGVRWGGAAETDPGTDPHMFNELYKYIMFFNVSTK